MRIARHTGNGRFEMAALTTETVPATEAEWLAALADCLGDNETAAAAYRGVLAAVANDVEIPTDSESIAA